MVADDTEMKELVRSLTDYDSSILTDSELESLLVLSKDEFWADTDTSARFYTGNKQADQALFWLLCLFSKIKVGELDAPAFEIAEIQVDEASNPEEISRWLKNYRKYRDNAVTGSKAGIGQISRSDRTYQFDN
ncbi:hypothetical protein [Halocatena halophila]|uniref:hypothetical protein n=1 Tax=Halocatena halophila TaxID=2814576 RepID=UPI002ED0D334